MLAFPLLLVAGAATACAQASETEALKAELEELRQQQAQTQKELERLTRTLRPVLAQLPQPFEPQEVSLLDSPVLGESSATITLVEFSDLQCPYCVRFYENTYPKIVKDYVDTGKVRYAAREFPLTTIHKEAQRASQAALCAGKQDKYWDMRAKIFLNRKALADSDLETYAGEVGVSIPEWKSCLTGPSWPQPTSNTRMTGTSIRLSAPGSESRKPT